MAAVAQLAARRSHNPKVGSSILSCRMCVGQCANQGSRVCIRRCQLCVERGIRQQTVHAETPTGGEQTQCLAEPIRHSKVGSMRKRSWRRCSAGTAVAGSGNLRSPGRPLRTGTPRPRDLPHPPHHHRGKRPRAAAHDGRSLSGQVELTPVNASAASVRGVARVSRERHGRVAHVRSAKPCGCGAHMRTPGVEPGSQAWEACMMPLHYVRRCQLWGHPVERSGHLSENPAPPAVTRLQHTCAARRALAQTRSTWTCGPRWNWGVE